MKKFTIGLAVLAVAALVGYSGTTLVLNNSRMLAGVTPLPGSFVLPVNSKPESRCPDCSGFEINYRAEQDKLSDMISEMYDKQTGYPQQETSPEEYGKFIGQIMVQNIKVKEAKEAMARCNELKKAYCEGFEDGKGDKKPSSNQSSSKPASKPMTGDTLPPKK